MRQAQRSILVVGGYVSNETFILLHSADTNISRKVLMLDHRSTLTKTLRETWAKWSAVWDEGGTKCRAIASSALPHTRYLFIDGARYHFDASLKDFGKRLTHFRLLEPLEARLVESEIDSAWALAVVI